jgi:hypothetical protein
MGTLGAGEHAWMVDFASMQLPAASYIYKVEVVSDGARHTDVKRMTLMR